jgi:glycosyltransferase involved in cell wall biosynthesis
MSSTARRPRVVLLRGHHANVWDLRPWERLRDDYDVAVLVTGSNMHQVEGLELEIVSVRTPRDVLPGARVAGAAAYALGERYLDLERHLAGADIVHGAEIGTWFAAQAAGLRRRMGFALALTVWETIAWRATYRWPRERSYRRRILGAADHFLPATERARDGLLLEGVAPERMTVCPPGIDLDHFAAARGPAQPPSAHRILSAGRLVWEKGHQDVLRAFAALRRVLAGTPHTDVELLVVGDGPERGRLQRYARELGVADSVEFRPTVPYDDMPALYASASALVLASLPTRGWEEQFGMVLVEALAARTPVIACSTGAIPEVLGADGTLVAAGDWLGLAQALGQTLSGAPAARAEVDRERLERFSSAAAAERLRAVYADLLERAGRSPKRPATTSR